MTAPRYAALAALAATVAVSGCAQASQVTGGQPTASIVAATAVSQPPSPLSANAVATAPAPPPRTAVPSSPPPTSSGPGPTEAAQPTVAAQTGPPGGDQPGPNGQLYSKHAAQLRLDADLAGLHLPVGAVRQTSPIPRAVDNEREVLGGEAAALDTWWTVPGTEAAATAYLQSHPPAGFGVGGSATTITLHGESVLEFVERASLSPQTVYNAGVAQDGDHVDVRVQLQVAYSPTRTAIETIPASVTSGTAIYQPPNQLLPGNAKPAPRRTATLSAADVKVLAAGLNGVDAISNAALAHSCPAPDGEEAWVTLVYGGHTVVFDASLGACGAIAVTSDGVPQPDLTLLETASTALRTALHVTKAENPNLP